MKQKAKNKTIFFSFFKHFARNSSLWYWSSSGTTLRVPTDQDRPTDFVCKNT